VQGPVYVSLVGGDEFSGPADTLYCLGAECVPDTSTGGDLITISDEGVNVLRYYSIDNAGNAEEINEVLIKIDNTAPVITLPESLITKVPIALNNVGVIDDLSDINSESYLWQQVGGDGEVSFTNVNIKNPIISANADGVYTISLTVSDNAGNTVTETMTFIWDTTAPVLTLIGGSIVSVEVGSGAYEDAGATATDNYDGDLTESIIVGGDVVNTDVVDSYTIIYSVTDSAGNIEIELRTVNVVDTIAPVIILLGNSPVEVEVGSEYVDAGATATDNYDEELVVDVDNSELNLNTLGTYSIYYDVVDSSGNIAEQVVRTVNVVDKTAPVITLNGNSVVSVELGDEYVDAGATATDNYDEELVVDVDNSELNINTLGTYSIYYDVVDSSGNIAEQVVRTVNVVDTIAPVITLGTPANNYFEQFNGEANSVDVVFDVEDNGELSCAVYLNDEFDGNAGSEGSWYYTFNGLNPGQYSWYIICSDEDENSDQTETRYFTILSDLADVINFTNYTDLTSVDDITNVTGFFVGNEYGSIEFTNPIDFSSGADWTQYITILNNSIYVNSSGLINFNVPAIITFFGLGWTTPELLINGVLTSEYNLVSYNASSGTWIINISGFSEQVNYVSREYVAPVSPPGPGGGGGGGSGGGSSGCITDWNCSEWSECIDGTMTRICNYKIAYCKPEIDKPIETMMCGDNSGSNDGGSVVQDSDLGEPAGITGATIGGGKKVVKSILWIAVILGVLVAGYLIFKNREKVDINKVKALVEKAGMKNRVGMAGKNIKK